MHAHRSPTSQGSGRHRRGRCGPLRTRPHRSLPADTPATVPAADTVQTGGYVPAWVAIRTGATSSITLNTASGQLGARPDAGAGVDCGVDQGGRARFLTLEGTTRTNFTEGMASYQSGSIGVKEKKSGTSCSQVNAPTTEQPAAGSARVRPVGGTAGRELRLPRPRAQAERAHPRHASRWAASPRRHLRAAERHHASGRPALAGPRRVHVQQPGGLRSGLRGNNNCRWPISAPRGPACRRRCLLRHHHAQGRERRPSRSRAGLTAPSLPQSLPTTWQPDASVFELVDGTVDCGGQTVRAAPAATSRRSPSTRLGNVGTTTCAPVPYACRTRSRPPSSSSRSTARRTSSSCGTCCGSSPSRPGRRRCPSEDRLRVRGHRDLRDARLVPRPGVRLLAVPRLQRRVRRVGDRPGARPRQRPVRLRHLQGAKSGGRQPGRHRVARPVYVYGDAKTPW